MHIYLENLETAGLDTTTLNEKLKTCSLASQKQKPNGVASCTIADFTF